ncbi:myelin-oligodendrocyte glycoprotein [Hippoglossus stenolepis]|uniref:myelin-oligodendrocyte glycoprotein n=1 Tax=Hippoglossus stenolepis TaxID=195615 RepID=UPI001FAF44A4|nr:myelin-oligodendrocyte glycoprotein [Hippoglossus stenolepis]XP_035031209.2 myelin-oligodendrocyte glycoprotein [Hippoglossus stenolepis]
MVEATLMGSVPECPRGSVCVGGSSRGRFIRGRLNNAPVTGGGIRPAAGSSDPCTGSVQSVLRTKLWKMDKTLLTLLLIVPLVSGGFHPTCSNLSLTVEEGEDVSLWCGLVPSVNLMSYTVEVTRTDLRQFVLLYRDKRVLHYVPMEQYRNRTTLDLKGLIRGNISVQISSVKMSDRGDYTCLIPRLKPRCIITLDVGKDPELMPVLIPLGALLVVDFIRLRSGRNSLTGNCVTRCRGQKVKDPFTGYHAETGSGPVYIQDMVQPDEMRETGPCELRAETSPHLEH